MKNIIEQSGKTLKEFSEFYEIPYNTVRQWYNGTRSAPKWIRKLIERAANGQQLKIQTKEYYYAAIDWLQNGNYGLQAIFQEEENRNKYIEKWAIDYPGGAIITKTLIEK